MEEQRISFETAKLAKEKGFNEDCGYSYKEGKIYSHLSEGLEEIRKYGQLKKKSFSRKNSDMLHATYERFSAPTQSMLQLFLREYFGIDIVILPKLKDKGKFYGCKIYTNYSEYNVGSNFNAFQEALEAGLLQALKTI